MTSENGTGYTRLVVTAPVGTPCGWTAYGETGTRLTCQGGRDAVHILTETLPVAVKGTALCAYHSPWDMTEAERVELGQPMRTMGEAGAEALAARKAEADAYAAWVDGLAGDPSVEIIGGHPYGAKSGLPIFRNVADNSPGILARHRAAEAARTAEADASGVEILAELLTLDTPAEAVTVDVVKFHRLSPAMVGVLTAMGEVRGLVGAWAMRNVVIKSVKGASKRTVTALISRGIVADEINDGDQSGTGGLHDYVLTERGREVASILGVLAAELPDDIDGACALAAKHTEADCETGCEVIIARGVIMLPAGGDVCVGCGSIFTRPSGQLHPGLDMVSSAVVARNHLKGN